MSSVQFRQIGSHHCSQNPTRARRQIRYAKTRLDSLLGSRRRPSANQLLRVVGMVGDSAARAYELVPLQSLSEVIKQVGTAKEAIDDAIFVDRDMRAVRDDEVAPLRKSLLLALKSLPTAQEAKSSNPQIDNAIQEFLVKASDRGWRVNHTEVQNERDGFDESARYVERMAIHDLLPQQDDFGVVSASVVLVNSTIVPDDVLLEWTQPPYQYDIYVVFGHYVVIPNVKILGIRSHLVQLERGVKLDRFYMIARYLAGEGHDLNYRQLVPKPRRIRGHHYVPLVPFRDRHKGYFSCWDVLKTSAPSCGDPVWVPDADSERSQNGNSENG